MNKTIFKLNFKISTIVLSGIGILLAFLSNAFYINGFMSYMFYIFRGILFVGIFSVIYIIEKESNFKQTIKRFIGYFCICELSNIVFALFIIAHLLKGFFITVSSIVCLITIIACVFEIINVCSENRLIKKIIAILDKISSIFYNPVVRLFSNR